MPHIATRRSNGSLVTLGESLGLLTAAEYGPLAHSPQLRLRVAGAEANVAVGVRRLGYRATWCGVVGEDPIGDLVLRELRAEDVEVHSRRHPAPTATMIKERRGCGRVRIHYWRNGSAGTHLGPEDIKPEHITDADVLHITGITPALGAQPHEAVRTAIELAREAGTTISLDINYRTQLWAADEAKPVLLDLVKNADIVFASADEAELLLGSADPAQQAQQLARLGPSDAIVKIGADGATLAHGEGVIHEPAVPVDVVDPVGAGDAAAAGYLAAWLDGHDADARLQAAVRTAAFVVGTDGDWEGLPTSRELAQLLGTGDPVSR